MSDYHTYTLSDGTKVPIVQHFDRILITDEDVQEVRGAIDGEPRGRTWVTPDGEYPIGTSAIVTDGVFHQFVNIAALRSDMIDARPLNDEERHWLGKHAA